VAPSDCFFYLFAVVEEARRMGIPFVVAQRETTITDYTMNVHSQQVRDWAPSLSDFMTVCSERHKEFWLRAGCQSDRIEVTGQPRFDFYYQKDATPTRPTAASDGSSTAPLLFLGYDLNAYADTAQGATASAEAPWRGLRADTTSVLYDVAQERGCDFVIKPHPQQDRRDVELLRRELEGRVASSPTLRARIADPSEDTRVLIRNAGVVVGFQTTALFEALAAGKVVIYTGWGDEFARQKEILIPFHEWSHFIHFAESPDDLRRLIIDPPRLTAKDSGWLHTYREYLGPTDGRASERTWAVITRVVEKLSQNRHQRSLYRAQAKRRAHVHRRREVIRGQVERLVLRALAAASRGLPFGGKKVAELAYQWTRRLDEITTDRTGQAGSPQWLVGRSFTTLPAFVERWLRTRFNIW
jgi:hypothetical protein